MTRNSLQARVQSLLESVISGMQGFGFVLGGALGAAFSARFGFAVAGAGTLVLAAAAAAVMRGLSWGEEAAPAEAGTASPADSSATLAESEA